MLFNLGTAKYTILLKEIVKSSIEVGEKVDDTVMIKVSRSAVFSTWIPVKRAILRQDAKNINIDLSETKFVDHTVMAAIDALSTDYAEEGRNISVVGVENHRRLSDHRLTALKA